MGKRTLPKPWNMPGRKGCKRKPKGIHVAHGGPATVESVIMGMRPPAAPAAPEPDVFEYTEKPEDFGFEEAPAKFALADLEAMKMKELRVIAAQFEVTAKTKAALIQGILGKQ